MLMSLRRAANSLVTAPAGKQDQEFATRRCSNTKGLFAAVRMPLIDPSRHVAALQQFGRFRSEADISERFAERIYMPC